MDLKVILVQFILFTLVEGTIYAMFYYKWCKCNKFKLYQILIMSIGNYVIATTLPPLVYQGVMIIWMAFCIIFVQKRFKPKYFVYPLAGMLGVLAIESIYDVLFEIFTGEVLLNFVSSGGLDNIDNIIYLFIVLLPTKLIEIFIVNKRGVIMKSWTGEIVRK